MGTLANQIPLIGVPAAWFLKLTGNSTTLTVPNLAASSDAVNRMKFDNLASNPKISIKLDSAAATEKTEVTRADGAIIQFPKTALTLDGTDESVVTDPADETTDKGEVTIEVNEGDIDSDGWTTFLKKIYDNQDAYWLICVPTAFTYDGRRVQSTGNADGFFYMVGKLSSAIEPGEPPAATSLTFVSVACPYGTSTNWTTNIPAIDWDESGDTEASIALKGVSGFKIAPVDLLAADATALRAGKIVLKKHTFA